MAGTTIQASSLSIQGLQHPSTLSGDQLLVPSYASTLGSGLGAKMAVTRPILGLERPEHLGDLE